VALRGDTLGRPSGIALDAPNKRFVIVQLGGKSVLAWRPGDKVPTVIGKGPGGFDGVVVARRKDRGTSVGPGDVILEVARVDKDVPVTKLQAMDTLLARSFAAPLPIPSAGG